MLIDGSQLADGADLRAEVCIVGGGPAGLVMAQRLAAAGRSVVVLESGGVEPSVAAQQLNRGDVVGHATWPLHKSRFRTLGGSGTRWGGWCRPLDEADLLPYPWLDDGGWPLDHATLLPYLREAGDELGLDTDAQQRLLSRRSLPADAPSAPALATAGFEPIAYEVSPMRQDFGVRFTASLASAASVRVVTSATVTDIRLAPASDRVDRIEAATPARSRIVVRAEEFVLAAGGLENPRLLLAATSDRPAGLGNEHDLVGRYFMEHVHGVVGHLALGPAAAADPVLRELAHDPATSTTLRALAGTPRARAEARLQAISVMAVPAPYEVWHPLIDLPPTLSVPLERLRRRLTAAAARDADDASLTRAERLLISSYRRRRELRSARDLGRVRDQVLGRGAPASELRTLYARAEQRPHRDSRVRLASTRDRFGVRQVELDWRLTDDDTASVDAWVRRLQDATERLDDVTVLPDPAWRDSLEGGPHHMGTTRMAATSRHGVVDEHCRVHSVINLHVAGSSVFSTGGYANPTFTLVALALRLADRLAQRSTASAALPRRGAAAAS